MQIAAHNHAVQRAAWFIYKCVRDSYGMHFCACVQIRTGSSNAQSATLRAAIGVLAACKLPNGSHELRWQLAEALSDVFKCHHSFIGSIEARELPAEVR